AVRGGGRGRPAGRHTAARPGDPGPADVCRGRGTGGPARPAVGWLGQCPGPSTRGDDRSRQRGDTVSTHAGTHTEDVMGYDEALTRFDPVLGLEVHVELNTATKMFCGCATGFGADPNTQVCPVCLGLPGALPVVNGAAVESAIRIGLALNCSIA